MFGRTQYGDIRVCCYFERCESTSGHKSECDKPVNDFANLSVKRWGKLTDVDTDWHVTVVLTFRIVGTLLKART